MFHVRVLLLAVLLQNQKTIMPCVPAGLFILMNRSRSNMTEYVIGNPPGKVSTSIRKTCLVISLLNINNTCSSGALNISLLKTSPQLPRSLGELCLKQHSDASSWWISSSYWSLLADYIIFLILSDFECFNPLIRISNDWNYFSIIKHLIICAHICSLLTSVGIEPTTSGLDLPLLCRR